MLLKLLVPALSFANFCGTTFQIGAGITPGIYGKIEILRSQRGMHGGRLYLARIPEFMFDGKRFVKETYFELIDPATNQRYGNPVWMIALLGEPTASFFGFKALGGDFYTFPNPMEFAGAVRKYNRWAQANYETEIPVKFYPTYGGNTTETISYFKRGLKRVPEIPLSNDGGLAIHDISLHAPSIVLPPSYVRTVVESQKILLEFYDFMMKRFPNGMSVRGKKDFEKVMNPEYLDDRFGLGGILTQMMMDGVDLRWAVFRPDWANLTLEEHPKLKLRELSVRGETLILGGTRRLQATSETRAIVEFYNRSLKPLEKTPDPFVDEFGIRPEKNLELQVRMQIREIQRGVKRMEMEK